MCPLFILPLLPTPPHPVPPRPPPPPQGVFFAFFCGRFLPRWAPYSVCLSVPFRCRVDRPSKSMIRRARRPKSQYLALILFLFSRPRPLLFGFPLFWRGLHARLNRGRSVASPACLFSSSDESVVFSSPNHPPQGGGFLGDCFSLLSSGRCRVFCPH